MKPTIKIGRAVLSPVIEDGWLRSLGGVDIGGTAMRNKDVRFMPWFDSYEGHVFNRFRFKDVQQDGSRVVLHARAMSDTDYPFREKRDSSGDVVFRAHSWDAPPHESDLRVCFEPVDTDVDGIAFTGFRYWFEYEADPSKGDVPIHRLIDRQTWELGGSLEDVTLSQRSWLVNPRFKVGVEDHYTTAGLAIFVGLLPGNLWGRWSLMPSFDMQYGQAGTMLGWFDRVSLIRHVCETLPGENELRYIDMHCFEQGTKIATNPKTILWSPQKLDDIDALNLWTRVHDMERDKARAQFNMPEEEPPAITTVQNQWVGFRFDHSYDNALEVAAEFGCDYLFIDPVWEHEQAWEEELDEMIGGREKRAGTLLEKKVTQNMCCTIDFKVAKILGGEEGLKAFCDKAAAKDVKVLSWIATHYTPVTSLGYPHQDPEKRDMGAGNNSIFAAKESGRHPDTGYPFSCWTANLNAPVGQYMLDQMVGVCERTGLKGFLWDSFCNLGWFQVDYSQGNMRPQYDRMTEMYAEMVRRGLYIMPEAVVTFSSHSCCGLHGGNTYTGDLLGYSYDTSIALHYEQDSALKKCDHRVLMGIDPIDEFFQCYAHRRVPNMELHLVSREKWHAESVQQMKELFATYKKVRHEMKRRTVLRDGLGVIWQKAKGDADQVFFAFKDQPTKGQAVDVATGEQAGDTLKANRVYRVEAMVS